VYGEKSQAGYGLNILLMVQPVIFTQAILGTETRCVKVNLDGYTFVRYYIKDCLSEFQEFLRCSKRAYEKGIPPGMSY